MVSVDCAGPPPSGHLCPTRVVSNNISTTFYHILMLLTTVIFYGASAVIIFAERLQWKRNLYTENHKDMIF